MKKMLINSVVALSVTLAPSVYGATWVVSKWGTNNSSCGPGASPCRTISYALLQAAAYDRVVVHPGKYVENLVIDLVGLEITSLSGRSATVIESSTGTADHVVTISASNVTLGEKAKGFTFQGGNDGVNISDSIYSNIKIEGNLARNNGDDGFSIQGTDPQVRFNAAEGNSYGFFGFSLNSGLIQKNTSSNNTNYGYSFGGSGLTINQNISTANPIGVNVGGSSHVVNSNMVVGSSNQGLYVNIGSTSVRGNIAAESGNYGLYLTGGSGTAVENNLAVGGGDMGIRIDTSNGSMNNNAAIDNAGKGIQSDSTFTSFMENNTYGNTGFGLSNQNGVILSVVDHFLGSDSVEGGILGSFDTKPNLFKVGIAKGLGQ